MAHTYTKLLYHCTFSTRDRVAYLYDDIRPRVHAYIAQVIRNDYGFLWRVGGMDDHVHILCEFGPTHSVADFMSRIKSVSSGWIHDEFSRLDPGSPI